MEQTINLLGIRQNGITICRINEFRSKSIVVMEAITEQQELRIDKSKNYYGSIRYERDDKKTVYSKNIFLYGELDFNNAEDIHNIKQFNLINSDGAWIHSNVNYEDGTFTTIDRRAKQFQTWDCLKLFKYCHLLLGKPKRIIVYKILKTKLHGN